MARILREDCHDWLSAFMTCHLGLGTCYPSNWKEGGAGEYKVGWEGKGGVFGTLNLRIFRDTTSHQFTDQITKKKSGLVGGSKY